MSRRAPARDAPLPPTIPMHEAELAARWAAGAWRGATLHALSGATYRVIFEGRNGGPGPDFRDAALATEDGARLLGDIELHLRARDWLAHGHHTDARYNRVILHVALDAASSFSPLESGGDAPIVCLSVAQAILLTPPEWPCANMPARIGPVPLRALLLWVGKERFERRVRALRDALRFPACESHARGWSADDGVLWVALAEAVGYGRHREALRHAGLRLLAGAALDLDQASRSERRSLAGLLALWERWSATGPWRPLREALMAEPEAVVAAPRGAGGVLSRALSCSCAHPGGKRRLPVRGGAGEAVRRCGAGRAVPYGVPRPARAAVEPDHARDDQAARPGRAPRRGGGAAGTASPLGGLVSREGLRALPVSSAPNSTEDPIGNRGLIRYDVCATPVSRYARRLAHSNHHLCTDEEAAFWSHVSGSAKSTSSCSPSPLSC